MSRLFTPKYEVASIHRGVDRDLQRFSGTTIDWYVFDPSATVEDDIYDWGNPRAWLDPKTVRVVDAVDFEGSEQPYEQGLFTRDRLRVVVSQEEIRRVELDDLLDNFQPHLKDRFVYNDRVFSPSDFSVSGEVREYGTMVGITALHVRPDELVNDVTFASYAG